MLSSQCHACIMQFPFARSFDFIDVTQHQSMRILWKAKLSKYFQFEIWKHVSEDAFDMIFMFKASKSLFQWKNRFSLMLTMKRIESEKICRFKMTIYFFIQNFSKYFRHYIIWVIANSHWSWSQPDKIRAKADQ